MKFKIGDRVRLAHGRDSAEGTITYAEADLIDSVLTQKKLMFNDTSKTREDAPAIELIALINGCTVEEAKSPWYGVNWDDVDESPYSAMPENELAAAE